MERKSEIKKLSKLFKQQELKPSTINEEERSFEVIFSKGTRGLRSSFFSQYYEELSLEPEHVRLDRLNNSAPFLKNHRSSINSVLGVVTEARIENGEGVAKIVVDKGEEGSEIFRKISEGILKKISVGYKVHKYKDISEKNAKIKTLRAIDWEPVEISLVAVAFDDTAQVRSEDDSYECEILNREESTMEVQEALKQSEEAGKAAEQTRIFEINKLCKDNNLTESLTERFIRENRTISEIQTIVESIQENKRESEETKVNNIRVDITRDEQDTKKNSIESAILYRANVNSELLYNAKEYRDMSLMEMAKQFCPQRGIGKSEIAIRALSTKDFGDILSNVVGKSLRKAYEQKQQTFIPFVQQGLLPDFKDVSRISFGSMPSLELIKEDGEYKEGSILNAPAEKYHLSKYGKIINITYEVIVNDDLQAFTRVPALFGTSAARLETKLIYSILTGKELMGDKKELFCKEHGNLAAKGSGISDDALSLGRKAMRMQKFGDDILDLTPKFLVAGPELETDVRKFLSTGLYPSLTKDINTFGGTLEPIIDGNISGKQWFFIADPSEIDTIELGYLEGEKGPQISQKQGFEIDGVKIKCRHVVGAKAIDWRGIYKNGGSSV